MADLEVQYLQVQTTTDSRAEAMELSLAAVESRLAACAQVAGPVASMYWWMGGWSGPRNGSCCSSSRPTATTSRGLHHRTAQLRQPEIVALPIVTGSAAYLNWMREETRPTEGAPG